MGDVNPYGVARIPRSSGSLVEGNILVSNFNNSANLQGTGTTIVQIAPDGTASLFTQIDATTLPGPCPGGVGLTTALVVLRARWVVVGSLPTTDGTAATAQAGCLLVIDNHGNVAETFNGSLINGPWDMTAWDAGNFAELFVTNVLKGTVAAGGNVVQKGTVIRLALNITSGSPPSLQSITVIGSASQSEPIPRHWLSDRQAWASTPMPTRSTWPIVSTIALRPFDIRCSVIRPPEPGQPSLKAAVSTILLA